jgi:hypothetical protein
MDPANETTPEPTAVTCWPWLAGKSTPRCPDPNGEVGGSNTEVIAVEETPGRGRPHGYRSPAATPETEVRTGIIQNTDNTGTHGGIFMCSASPKLPTIHYGPPGIVTYRAPVPSAVDARTLGGHLR